MGEYLSLEEVSNTLPSEMKIDFRVKRRDYIVYTTAKGELLPIANASLIDNTFMYNICTEYYKKIGCKHIVLVVGKLGIIVIPTDVLLEYNKHAGWKMISTKGKQYWIRGNNRSGTLKLTCSMDHSYDIDATQYFHQFVPKSKIGTKKAK